MIRTEAGFEATLKGLGHLLRALRDTHVHRADCGSMYREFAGQTVEEILKLRAEIDEYTGLTAFLKEFGPPPPIDEPAPPANGTADANGSPSDVSSPSAAPSA